MRKLFSITTLCMLILLAVPVGRVEAQSGSLSITASSGGTGPNQGTFSPASVEVEAGTIVTITFSVPSDDPYCCGIQVKAANGAFDTGTINKGSSKDVTFTAESSFNFTSYWPNTGTVKATGTVSVTEATPQPPAKVTGLKATALSTSQIQLNWKTAAGATSYEIYRDNKLIDSTNNIFYDEKSLEAGTKYNYKIVSVAESGLKADPSSTVSASTLKSNDTTVTPTPDPSGTPSEGPGDNVNPPIERDVFIDEQYDYADVDGIIYGFDGLTEIPAGTEMKIWGRTEANASVSIVVESQPVTFSTTSDDDGYWYISIDTTDLEPGEHTFTTSITPEGETGSLTRDAVAFTVVTAQATTTPQPTATPSADSGAGQTDLGIALMGTGGILILLAALLYLFKGRR